MKTQNENIQELLRLIAENPDLPIVPKVDSDIIADEGYSCWLGGWGIAEVDRYIVDDEKCYFELYGREELVDREWDRLAERTDLSDEQAAAEAEKAVDALKWIKCIAVRITAPL